jgi:hypothetical protein
MHTPLLFLVPHAASRNQGHPPMVTPSRQYSANWCQAWILPRRNTWMIMPYQTSQFQTCKNDSRWEWSCLNMQLPLLTCDTSRGIENKRGRDGLLTFWNLNNSLQDSMAPSTYQECYLLPLIEELCAERQLQNLLLAVIDLPNSSNKLGSVN